MSSDWHPSHEVLTIAERALRRKPHATSEALAREAMVELKRNQAVQLPIRSKNGVPVAIAFSYEVIAPGTTRPVEMTVGLSYEWVLEHIRAWRKAACCPRCGQVTFEWSRNKEVPHEQF